MFSFGRDKVLSTVSGGIAISTDKNITKRLGSYASALPYPSRRWVAQRLTYPAVFAIAKYLYAVGPIGKIIIETSKRLGIVPLVIQPAEKNGTLPTPQRMPNVLTVWAIRQMQQLESRNAHRRQLAALYANGLRASIQNKTLHVQTTRPHTEPLWLRWSVAVADASALHDYCKQRGILLGDWYNTPIAPRDTKLGSVRYTIGSCKRAEDLASRVVNLPTSINTSAADAQHIIDAITQFYTTRL
jgi:dTDP-4-amino-4,6-dideoxygalactose transaminase